MKNALRQSLTAVGLVIILGFSGSRATQREIKPAVERWPIKTSVLAGVDVSHGTPVAYADLVKLDDAPVGKNGHRPQAARIPAFTPPRWSQPGDYHIQISDNHDSQASCLIVEVPNPDPVSASPTPRPRATTSAASTRGLGLNRRQIQILATAHPKRQYYVLSPLGTAGHISLGLGAGSSELCRNGGKGGIVQVSEQMTAQRRLWHPAWLRRRGREAAAKAWIRQVVKRR